ncbi:MAG TPA: hypothetical protein PLA83_04055 [Deltaproteobacteria bacterium]|jgi:predicted transcriptional regulator|nr:hypothetical protein [Deltaproteobacteria bacterium]HQI00419.1 hypothetical protein [Deltaproteobacteria bacterium]HQJ07523.1 hypothetical protein [Deltaproteobacteria bacterium]
MRLDSYLMKKVKILAIEEGKKTNSIIEEALIDLINKYEHDLTHSDMMKSPPG